MYFELLEGDGKIVSTDNGPTTCIDGTSGIDDVTCLITTFTALNQLFLGIILGVPQRLVALSVSVQCFENDAECAKHALDVEVKGRRPIASLHVHLREPEAGDVVVVFLLVSLSMAPLTKPFLRGVLGYF